MADEKCIFMAGNILSQIVTRSASVAAASGYDDDNVYDNLHYTEYKANATGTVRFNHSPAAQTTAVDCVVIDSVTTLGSVTVVVNRNGANKYNQSYSIQKGANYIPLSDSGVINAGSNTFYIEIQAGSGTVWIRHLWATTKLEIKSPSISIDPLSETKRRFTVENDDRFVMHTWVESSKKRLTCSWQHVSGTDLTNLQTLKSKAWDTDLPWYFFFRPTSSPNEGWLYIFDMEKFELPYQVGTHRGFTIEGVADFTPEDSVTTY